MADTAPAIQTLALTRLFGPLRAVDALELAAPAGRTFGLLGSNGAGKSNVDLLRALMVEGGQFHTGLAWDLLVQLGITGVLVAIAARLYPTVVI